MIAISFLILFFLYSNVKNTKHLSFSHTSNSNFIKYQYGVIVDAGSSGSRIFIYKWPPHSGSARDLLSMQPMEDKNGSPIVKKATPGLSNLATQPNKTASYIKPLLDLAADNIPSHLHKETPLYIMATAGMRLISKESRDAILQELRHFIVSNYRFLFSERHATVISGSEEGIYGWIATNYLLGRFNHDHSDGVGIVAVKGTNFLYKSNEIHHRKRTVGVIDMGGGSMQIAYEVSADYQDFYGDVKSINLGCLEDDIDHTYRVYVTTFLGFGANMGRTRYERAMLDSYIKSHHNINNGTKLPSNVNMEDPCLHPGLQYTKNVKLINNNTLNLKNDKEKNSKTDNSGFHVDQHQGGLFLSAKQTNQLPSISVTFHGNGQYHLCELRLAALLNKKPCVHKGIDTTKTDICTMSSKLRPPLPDPDTTEFYGFSEFWYSTNDVLGLGGPYNYFRLHSKSMDYCKQNWFSISLLHKKKIMQRVDWPRLRYQCFKSAWLSVVLHSGLGFSQSYNRLTTVHSIKGAEVQWSLGALIYQTRYFPQTKVQEARLHSNSAARRTVNSIHYTSWKMLLLILFSIVVVFILVMKIHNISVNGITKQCKLFLFPGSSLPHIVNLSKKESDDFLFPHEDKYLRVSSAPSFKNWGS